MNGRLAEVVSNEFYEGRLSSADDVPPTLVGHFRYEPVNGVVQQDRFHSRLNQEEGYAVLRIIDELRRFYGVDPATVTVLSPYRGQVSWISSQLARSNPGVRVHTIDVSHSVLGSDSKLT